MVTKADQTFHHIFDALGHETRRQILLLLRGGPQPVGTLARQLPVTRPAVSKHLRILRTAGLVTCHSEGTRNVFRIEPGGFESAAAHLSGFWDVALDNFKRVVES